jgi:hypothetical protein
MIAGTAALLMALDSSFVIWGMSGLENALLAFLLASSAFVALGASDDGPAWRASGAGLLAGLLALTRPDAVVYAAAYPAALLLARPSRLEIRPLVCHTASFGAVFGAYLLFRRLYFGDWVPNTFHAKVRPWMMAVDGGRVLDLARAAVGPFAVVALVLVGAVAIAGARGVAAARRTAVLSVYLLLAAAAYVLLPPDWMGEYRFATGFFLFFYWSLAEALAFAGTLLGGRRLRHVVPACALLLVAQSATSHAERTQEFVHNPTVPFARVSRFARDYDALAARLGPGPYSLLTPDLGGMLFFSRMRIYDLGGLCDRTIAKTLMGNGEAFRDYVFAATRPTFIHVHGTWSDWAALHKDARFARDYAPLYERWERPAEAAANPGEPWVGDYVRRDALASDAQIAALSQELRTLGLDRALP